MGSKFPMPVNQLESRPRLAVFGHVGHDINIIADVSHNSIGGAAYYVTRTCHSIGNPVILITSIGHDLREEIESIEGLDLSCAHFSSLPSPVFQQRYDHRNEIVEFTSKIGSGAQLHTTAFPENADVFFITSCPPEDQAHAFDRLQKQNFDGKIAIDTTLEYAEEFNELVLRRFADRIDFLFCNKAEFERLSAPELAGKIIVKCGAAGAKLLAGGAQHSVPAAKSHSDGFFTGAGDVLAASFLCRHLSGSSDRDALLVGVENASEYVLDGPRAWQRWQLGEVGDG